MVLYSSSNNHANSTCTRNPSKAYSSQSHQHSPLDSTKTSCCIFCGDHSRTHLSQNCVASTNVDGTACCLLRHEPTGLRHSKSGKRYCYSWNSIFRCNHNPCHHGEHCCTSCRAKSHTVQQCDTIT